MPSAIRYPNDRTNPAGAIPVFLSSSPKAMPITIESGPTGVYSGPIPVYFAAGAGTPPFGTDQGNANNAVPVVISGAPNAMPVWDTAPGPPPVPVNTTPPSITPTGTLNSGTLLTLNTGVWTNNPVGFDIQWTRNNNPIVGANNITYMTTIADRNNTIGATVAVDNDGGRSSAEPTSNTVSIAGPPVNIIAPTITPVGPVNVGDTLSLNNGNWTGNPTGYYYGWTRNGSSISGQASNSYITTTADEGTYIGGVAQAANAVGGGIATATSNQVYVNPPTEPVIDPANFDIALPVSNGDFVGQCFGTDSPDAWAIVPTGSTPDGIFTIDGSGVVTVANASFVEVGTYTYTLYAQNSVGIGVPSTCTINVT